MVVATAMAAVAGMVVVATAMAAVTAVVMGMAASGEDLSAVLSSEA
ncbi:MAG TPA: hypothetical protein VF390_02155 [Patescibacteria group bacterium]